MSAMYSSRHEAILAQPMQLFKAGMLSFHSQFAAVPCAKHADKRRRPQRFVRRSGNQSSAAGRYSSVEQYRRY
jgi:hypothetical protein